MIKYDLVWFMTGSFTILTSYRIKRFCSWVYSCNFIVIFLIRQFSNLILVSIAGHYELSMDTMDSWGMIYSLYLHFSYLVLEIFGIIPIFCKLFAISHKGVFTLWKTYLNPWFCNKMILGFLGRTRICELNANWSRIDALL